MIDDLLGPDARRNRFSPRRAWRAAGDRRRELIRGSIAGVSTRGIEFSAKFLFQLLLARQLGTAASGLVFLAIAAATVAATLARFGVDLALTRHVAAALARGSLDAAHGLARRGMAVIAASATVMAIIVFLLSDTLANQVFEKPDLVGPLRWMTIGIVTFPLLHGCAAILGATKRIVQGQLMLSSSWSVLAIFGMLFAGVSPDGAAAVVALSMSASAAIGGVLAYRALRSATPGDSSQGTQGSARALLRTAWSLGAVDAAQTLITFGPTIILGIFAASDVVGRFAVANRLAMTVTSVLGGAVAMSLPQFAEAHALGRRDALAATARDLVRITLLLGLPMVLVMMLFPATILSLIGHDFAPGADILRILLLGCFPASVFFYASGLLSMTGHERDLRTIFFVIVLLGMGACVVLIPWLGGAGAAIATALMIGSVHSAAAIIASRRIGVPLRVTLGLR